jgi:transcription elongation factor Elf1
MSETQLPPVAKSFFTHCKKCDADRYHTVVAHTTATSAKLKCEICGAASTYKLPKAGAAAKAKRPLAGAAAKRKEAAASAKKNAHAEEFQSLMNSAGDPQSYTMKAKFNANTKLKHPKFGMGFVRTAQPDKIEVVFEDEVRSLVHNRNQ